MPAPISDSMDVERYTAWFAWARAALGRELEATHAAAEAAYRAQAAGGSEDDARRAAERAAGEPGVDAETIALAEWATWARSTAGLDPAASLLVARHAVARLESNHDLDAVIGEVQSILDSQQRPGRTRGFGLSRNALVVAGVVLALVVVGGATVGLIGAANQYNAPVASPPSRVVTMEVTVQPSGQGIVLVAGLEPGETVFIFVDEAAQKLVTADANGIVQTTVAVPLGGHTVAVCRDDHEGSCPASQFVTRSQ